MSVAGVSVVEFGTYGVVFHAACPLDGGTITHLLTKATF